MIILKLILNNKLVLPDRTSQNHGLMSNMIMRVIYLLIP